MNSSILLIPILYFFISIQCCDQTPTKTIPFKIYNVAQKSIDLEKDFIDPYRLYYTIQTDGAEFSASNNVGDIPKGLLKTSIFDLYPKSSLDPVSAKQYDFNISIYYYQFDNWQNAVKRFDKYYQDLASGDHLQMNLSEYYFVKQNFIYVLAIHQRIEREKMDAVFNNLLQSLIGDQKPAPNSIIKSYYQGHVLIQ